MTNLPRLLDSSLNEVRRLEPISATLNEKITPLSYASLELPAGQTVPARSFVEIFKETGFAGIFRVKSPQDAYGDLTISVELEHAITELGDFLVKANLNEESTVRNAFVKLFTYYGGAHWALGNFSASQAVVLNAGYGNSVLEAMLAILDQAPELMMTFDFTTTPWTFGVSSRDATVSAEGRLTRNVKTARITRDDTELCTRLFMDGLPGSTTDADGNANPGHIDADTISTYGVVEREINGSSDYTTAQATRAANLYLQKHKHPRLGVEISAADLAAITGEDLDTFRIGKKFRLAIESEGAVVEETITGLSWSDLYEAPQDVTVTLAQEEDTVVTALHAQDASGGKAGAASRKAARKSAVQTETEFRKEYAILDTQGNILQQAGMKLDANGLLVYANDNERNVKSVISATAEALDSTIWNTVNGHTTKFQQTDSKIGMVVGTTTDAGGGETYFVKAGEIALAINESTGLSEAKIDAAHVYIGYGAGNEQKVKVYVDGQISAESAKIDNITVIEGGARYVQSDKVYALSTLTVGNGVSGGSGTFYFRGSAYYPNFVVLKNSSNTNIVEKTVLGTGSANTSIDITHYHEISIEEGTGSDAGKMFVTLGAPSATAGTANFKIADTTAYINGVSAAKKAVKVQPFEANSWSQPTLPSSRTFTYKTDATGAASSTWQEDSWYLTGGTSWSGNNSTVYLRYGSTSGTAYAQLDITAPGGGTGAPTITLVSAVGTNSVRDGSSSDNRIYVDANANDQSTRQNFRLVSTTYTNGSGVSQYCVDLHAGTDSSGRRIGRISVQSRYDTGYSSGYAVGGQTAVLRYYGSTAPSGQTVTTLGRGSYYVVRHKESPSGSEIDGAYYYCPASDYQSGYNAGYAAGKDDLTWSWSSAASTSTTEPTGNFAKTYSWSKGYSWGYFTVTVNGHSYRFRIHITS